MSTNRFVNLLIVLALVALVGLTVREVYATAAVLADDSASRLNGECASLPARASIHTEYVQEAGAWMTYTEDGRTGMDGGVIHLLSMYRTCSE
jgi:hypothetical protein